MATITIELPDTIIQELSPSSEEISRHVLEAVVLEGYRSERYSRGEVAQLLELSWHETEQLLAEHGIPYQYTLEDLDEDRQTLNRVM
jgi:predicted HTH domain antitoxin